MDTCGAPFQCGILKTRTFGKKKVYLESEVYYMKTRKLRLLSALLALAMLLALLPTAAFAAGDTTYTATVNEINFKYTLDSKNNATITGVAGALPADGVVVIPDTIGGHPVTAIGEYAFNGSNVQVVDMSDANHLETIGMYAFLTCASLARVDFPQNGVLKTIGYGAFSTGGGLQNGAKFEKLCIPATVETIGYGAFLQCPKLNTVTFAPGSNLKKIGSFAFSQTALESITIPEKVTTIGEGAFLSCASLKTVTFAQGSNLKKIESNAFSGTVLESITIPEKVTTIGEGAFYECTSLGSITIPSSVTSIESRAFSGCTKLGSITIPSSVTSIGWGAFCKCTGLGSITIPSSVTTIGSQAFAQCSDLQSVTFAPNSGLQTIGGDAFKDCTALETISCESALKEKLSGVVSEKIISVTHWNVKFVTDDGTTTELVENNTTVAERTAPAKDGYIFAGWYTKDANDKWADKPFDFSKAITDDTTLYARWGVEATPIDPATRLYPITIDYGTAYDADHNVITKAAKGETVYVEASETALDGMTFERWEVRKGDVTLENDRAAKTSFTMPDGEVQLEAMYQAAEVHDSGWDAATVVTGVAVGTGTAILAYHIGMEVYAEQVLGKDVAVPRTRAEVALLAWQLAGSPAVNVEGEPLSEAAQAQRWAVESGLMQKDAEGNFNGTKKMSKWNALRTLDKVKKMG